MPYKRVKPSVVNRFAATGNYEYRTGCDNECYVCIVNDNPENLLFETTDGNHQQQCVKCKQTFTMRGHQPGGSGHFLENEGKRFLTGVSIREQKIYYDARVILEYVKVKVVREKFLGF